MRILICGGSGYLGQFLIQALHTSAEVVYTFASRELPGMSELAVTGVKVDLTSTASIQELFTSHGPFQAVINCAAISQPAACEQDPAAARELNVPTHLLSALEAQFTAGQGTALLVHLSTDQVYDGSRAWWQEEDSCQPVNEYGLSKLLAEQTIKAHWPLNAVCLRSSIIIGPQPPFLAVSKSLFIQFIEQRLRSLEPTTFFTDEWRCPIYVQDICRIILLLIQRQQDLLRSDDPPPPYRCFNMGGPDRLSRADMAFQVARVLGLPTDTGLIVPLSTASLSRPFASPADISMQCEQLVYALRVQLTPFSEAVSQILSSKTR